MSAEYKICLLAATFVVIASAGYAQTPERNVATYGDWAVRCGYSGTPPQKTCDVANVLPPRGQTPSPVMQVLIARPAKKEPMRLVVQLQANVFIASNVKLIYDDKQPVLILPIVRCFPTACFATGPLADDVAKRLRIRTEPGRIEFKDGAEHDITIPISFHGFTVAFDAWIKE